jgi:hypothetical protein
VVRIKREPDGYVKDNDLRLQLMKANIAKRLKEQGA